MAIKTMVAVIIAGLGCKLQMQHLPLYRFVSLSSCSHVSAKWKDVLELTCLFSKKAKCILSGVCYGILACPCLSLLLEDGGRLVKKVVAEKCSYLPFVDT